MASSASYQDWLHAPMPERSSDPRVTVRRLRPDELPIVYDLVDAAFGVARPRQAYDWLYRHNPFGLARCIAALDAVSGRIVSTSADYPWPIAHGATPVPGAINGDMATLPEWQGKRLFGVLDDFRACHAWAGTMVRLAWPNARSVKALLRRGEQSSIAGRLQRRVVPLSPGRLLGRLGAPRVIAAFIDRPVGAALRAWQRMRLPTAAGLHVDAPRRFDSSADALSARAAAPWSGYWSPHGADFLNWRYLDDPLHSYAALTAARGDRPVALSVVRIEAERALLMELTSEPDMPEAAALLLQRNLDLAREAGCAYLETLAPARWSHWPLFAKAGAIGRPSDAVLQVLDADSASARALDNWLLCPGDQDGA